MKKTTYIFMLFFAIAVYAQASSITVTLTDGVSNESLRAKMENSIARILNEINAAQAADRDLNFSAMGVDANVQRSMSMLWENTPFLCTDEEIVEGMQLLICAVRQHQPKARIYQVGIMPRRGQLQRVAHVNALLQEKLKTLGESAEGKGWDVTYVDMSRGFLDDSGNLIESLFSDGLHPNARGYEVEAQNLYPYIK